MKYAKTLKENLQLLKEGTIYTVIRTKNGKVDDIEKVEQLANGTYMKKAGTSFDRAFIGMDPQEAKNALVKYSHFDPKLIMIDEGCGKIEEADVPTSKRELYSKAKIGFNGLKNV